MWVFGQVGKNLSFESVVCRYAKQATIPVERAIVQPSTIAAIVDVLAGFPRDGG